MFKYKSLISRTFILSSLETSEAIKGDKLKVIEMILPQPPLPPTYFWTPMRHFWPMKIFNRFKLPQGYIICPILPPLLANTLLSPYQMLDLKKRLSMPFVKGGG